MERELQLEMCTVDLDRRLVTRDGQTEALTEQETALLEYLAARPGQAVSRDELLREVWGFEAENLVTRAVDVAVRRLRMKVEKDPSSPAHVLTVRHVGYRFEAAPTRMGVAPETPGVPPQRRAAPPVARLPTEVTKFVGRDADLAAVRDAMGSERALVSLVGPPGVGKTRLAVRLGHEIQGDALEVAFIDLAAARSGTDLVQRVGDAMRIPLDPGAPLESRNDQLARALSGRGPLLLILDNFEQILDAAHLVPPWLEVAPGLRVLVTSRERMRLEAETVVALEPLSEDAGVELFLVRAQALARGYGSEDAEAIERIVQDLDGIPLAIELAAARAPVLPPRALLDGLQQRFRLLGGPSRDGDPRQATLHGALEWSWSLLSPFEQDALSQLSVFEASFAMGDADAVVDLTAYPTAPWVLDWLQSMVDKSMLQAVKRGGGRFELLQSQRAFALDQLAQSGELESAQGRHRDWVLALGEQKLGELHSPRGRSAIAELRLLVDDVRAVWRRSRRADPEGRIRAAKILDALFEITGPLEERFEVIEAALEVAKDPAERAHLLLARSEIRSVQAEQELSMAAAREAAVQAERAERIDLMARCMEQRAWLLEQRSAYAEATGFAERSLELAVQSGDRVCEAWAHNRLGHLKALVNDLVGAEQHYRAMGTIAQDLGSWRLEVRARSTLGFVARSANRFDEAQLEYTSAFELAQAAGDVVREATLLGNLGALASARGDLDEAVELFRQSLERHRATGNRRLETMALGNYGIVLMGVGRLREARSRLVEATTLADKRDSPRARGMMEGNLGVCQVQLGELEQARAHLERAAELLSVWGTPFTHAYFSAHLAIVCADLDDLKAAELASGNASPDLGDHPIVQGLRAVMRGHFELARGRQAMADGRDPVEHQERFERALEKAEQICAQTRDVALANALNAVLPSELTAALRNLRRTAVDRRLRVR